MILGAQLYTLKDYISNEKDIRYTLREVAKMGYTTIQVSAMGPIDPKVLKEICDELSLKIVLTHVDQNRILNDTKKVIEEHEILECDYIGIGSMPDRYRQSHWLNRFAIDFKEPAKMIADSGKLLMYHNHDFEFEKFNGKRMMETLMEDFSPKEMGVTLDTYWVQAAGADVCQWLDILQDRIHCVHLKDMAIVNQKQVMAPVLEGNMNFKAILKKLEDLKKTKYLLVEQDICSGSPFDCLQTSYKNLKKLGYR